MSGHGPFYVGYNNDVWSCKNIERSSTPLPLTALVSFPGSGNTWVRHMVQQATGIATGSLYNDSVIKYRGFPAEGIHDNTVSLIKTHEWGDRERSKYRKAVILIRDPFDTLLAEFNRQRSGHLGHAKEGDYSKYWHQFVYDNAALWPRLYNDWFQFKGPIHIIHFESLETNPLFEMQQLLKFLNLPVTDSDVKCMMRNRDGRFKRRTSKVLKRPQRFTFHMKNSIKTYKDMVTKELEKILHKSRSS
ncbi:hypothetical protein SNE40_004241 [Patella caerulea]|uniref:Sulfotransferase domain-containing protein n=1 Tax=Patella caerulea TaxID=87958 RepID=A0AAN8KG25_PATCE